MKNETVTIKTRKVGKNFGCASIIKIGRKVVWESRVFPLGFDASALEAARNKAADMGVAIA